MKIQIIRFVDLSRSYTVLYRILLMQKQATGIKNCIKSHYNLL